MSQSVYPTLPGLTFGVTRTPVWSTTKKTSVSQRVFRAANASYPLYRVKLIYEFLRQTPGYTEMQTLVGFFNSMKGDFDTFLWTDPDDNSVSAQTIGVGDALNKRFQLVRAFGGYVEPVFDINATQELALVYVNGALKTKDVDYTIGLNGLVTFVVAPGAGLNVTWTGAYYRRMAFTQSSAEFAKFMNSLWELKTIELESVKP